MIYVEPQKPDDKWLEKAKKATGEITEEFNMKKDISSSSFKPKVWKDLKAHLEKVFQNKCSYCEGKCKAGAHFTVEHYRPKSEVTFHEDNNSKEKVKRRTRDGQEQEHPGYYWLAYNYENLLLSCTICNENKSTRFPILQEKNRAYCPDDKLDTEEPFLLNPIKDKDIEEHITFGIGGMAAGTSERGEKTIEICNLNREDLLTARHKK